MLVIDEIIERMIRAFEAKSQAEMLVKAGFSNATASSWRKRKKISNGSILQVAELTGVSTQWLKTGEGEMRPEPLHEMPIMAEEASSYLRTLEVDGSPLTRRQQQAIAMLRFIEQHDPDQAQDAYEEITEVFIYAQRLNLGKIKPGEFTQADQPEIDTALLTRAIERTEQLLKAARKKLDPDQKALFISTLYNMAVQQGESALEESNVLQLLKSTG